MDAASLTWVIAGAAFLVSIGQIIFNGGWGLARKISKLEDSQSIALSAMESRLAQTVSEVAKEIEARNDETSKAFGESVKAVREQLVLNEKQSLIERHELSDQNRKIEIWMRDELSSYVKNESFREVCTRLENSVAVQARQMDVAIEGVRAALITLATRGYVEKQLTQS